MGIYEALPTCSGMPSGYDEWKTTEPAVDPSERETAGASSLGGGGSASRAAEVAAHCVWCRGEGPEEPCSEECERVAVRERCERHIAGWTEHRRRCARFAARYRREGDRRGSSRIVEIRRELAVTRERIAGLRAEIAGGVR